MILPGNMKIVLREYCDKCDQFVPDIDHGISFDSIRKYELRCEHEKACARMREQELRERQKELMERDMRS